jgi:ABC-2 type transport system permease protein
LVIFFLPAFLLAVFGYAVSFDVKHIKTGILNKDQSKESREFLRSLGSSHYFDLERQLQSDDEIDRLLNEKEVQLVVVIPSNFGKDINSNRNTEIQFLIDGVNGNTGSLIYNYVNAATMDYNYEIQERALTKAGISAYVPVELQSRFWFNPNLNSTIFLIPGLIALILIVTSVISVSLSLVREKERGTMEQLNVSSLSTIELLLGKSIPYVIISLIDAIFVLIAGYILFSVEVKGSYLLLFLSTFIFIAASISIGIFISAVSDSQQVAFTLGTFFSLLPSLILSGFIFPIESMPFLIQIITNVTPAKFYIIALRAIMLRGVDLTFFYEHLIYLSLFIIGFLGLATIVSNRKERTA